MRKHLTAAYTATVMLIGATPAWSQQQTSRARATIAGVVVDSLLESGPLSQAEVTVDGTEHSALTDSKGRFRIDGVARGRAVVRFYHASLDSLGFGATPVVVVVPDSGTASVRLATPSPATLRAKLCAGPQAASTGVVLGRVRNVDDRAPLPRASVSASWSEWSIGNGGLTRTERRAAATADENGSFALCGVPNDVAVVVRASAAGHVTGLVEVDLAKKLFGVYQFGVSLSDSGSSVAELARLDSAIARGDSVQPMGASAVTGVVRNAHGQLLNQAQVAAFGFPIAVRTGSEGQYALTRLPAGTQTIDVRAVGFAPRRLTVDLRSRERRTLNVTLDDAKAQELAPVNIVGRGRNLDRTGFEDRRKAGIGQFITDDEIKRRGVFETTQALWNVRGARVVWNGSDNVLMFTRPVATGRSDLVKTGGTLQKTNVGVGGYNTLCVPAYWIDGFELPAARLPEDASMPNVFVRPSQIRGIEAYLDPSSVPPQYRRPDIQCGVVLIWTKAPPPKLTWPPGR